ncbi:hypothetical protein HMPREF1981_00282 [Bacteroides pyogenes F0041]|uniref:Uncharacterized protein n=1 Tax=Bacteroides pyogenes F0041 TaxID=1321819 RepID=U2CW89_9BACE|nr:hypothetical protein HMPREF1981_00282 [Bacteroides pyogenes F0041]
MKARFARSFTRHPLLLVYIHSKATGSPFPMPVLYACPTIISPL